MSFFDNLLPWEKTSNANKDAASATQDALSQADALNLERYSEAQSYLSPYIGSAESANQQLQVEMGLAPGEASTAYMETPAYQQSIQSGIDTVNEGAANTGSLYTGSRGEALKDVGQATQSQYYSNYINMLSSMADPSAALNLSNMGLSQASSMGTQDLAAQSSINQYNIDSSNTIASYLSGIMSSAGTAAKIAGTI